MGRRANGEGYFKLEKDGRYSLRKQVGKLPNGRPKILTVSANSKSACIALMKEKEDDWNKHNPGAYVYDNITVRELCERHLREHMIQEGRLKPKSVDRREGTINNQIKNYKIGRLQITAVTPNDVKYHIEGLFSEGKISVSSVKKAFDVINSAYNWAVSQGGISYNPCLPVKDELLNRFKTLEAKHSVDKTIVVLSDDEKKRFIEAALSKTSIGTYRFPIGRYALILLYTGMRCGELCALRWSDYDRELRTLTISKTRFYTKNREQEKGYTVNEGIAKTANVRVIEINDEAVNILEEIYNSSSHTKPDDYVMLNRKHKPTNPSNMGACVGTIFKYAGLDDISGLHVFRRTFATEKYEETKDIKAVAAYIGDLDSTVSKYYIATTKKIISGGKTINIVPLPKNKENGK